MQLARMQGGAHLTDHERLLAWRTAMALLVECYRIARLLPASERYGMASQIRRAAMSVPANIAEGCGRVGPRDRLRFFSMARGSLCEVRTLLSAIELVGYAEAVQLAKARDLSNHTGRLLNGLRRYVARSVRSAQSLVTSH